jgi:hypothetical protein
VELWSGERPYTLWEAAVTDDGLVAGYAYGKGYMGGKRGDSFTVVLLEPDGTPRLEERHERSGHYSDIGTPEPLAMGMLVDRVHGRFLLRIEGPGIRETWWTYELASGSAGARIDPFASFDDEELAYVASAEAVPGTGLALVLFGKNHGGVAYALLDDEGRAAWRVDWPDDTVRRLARGRPDPILELGPGTFVLHRLATDERVAFAVERDAAGPWSVRETSRRPLAGKPEEH